MASVCPSRWEFLFVEVERLPGCQWHCAALVCCKQFLVWWLVAHVCGVYLLIFNMELTPWGIRRCSPTLCSVHEAMLRASRSVAPSCSAPRFPQHAPCPWLLPQPWPLSLPGLWLAWLPRLVRPRKAAWMCSSSATSLCGTLATTTVSINFSLSFFGVHVYALFCVNSLGLVTLSLQQHKESSINRHPLPRHLALR